MEPLRVTAHLSTKLSVSDDWSPSLDALLIKLLLDSLGLATSNPGPKEVAKNQAIIDTIPLLKTEIKGQWYWATSSPNYLYSANTTERIHKRWDCQELNLDWGGKRRNWSTSEGHTKAWTVLIPERDTPRIDWYCVGDQVAILDLLKFCDSLGKKRRTQVSRWEASGWDDWHLWRGDDLMRPIPLELLDLAPHDFAIRQWAWRPPVHIPSNFARCAMPIRTVEKLENLREMER
jgi:CRISPR type IV-associated protein Csf3